MRHSIRTIVLGASIAAAFVAAGSPPVARAATSSATIEFASAAGGIQDAAGNGTGLVERLPGTGDYLEQNDANLTLLTSTGRLRIAATPSDINDTTGDSVGENLGIAEFLGVRLSAVEPRFGPASDFSVSAVIRGVPDLGAGAPQYGVFAGTSAAAVVRGGVLHGNNWRFTTTSQDSHDSRPLTTTGSVDPGHDLRIDLTRKGGTWAMSITDLTTSVATDLVFPPQPAFLDAASELWVGVFAGCPSGPTFAIEVDSLTVQAEPDEDVAGPPAAPLNLSAKYVAGEGVVLTWDAPSTDETGFELQRRSGTFGFGTRATTGPAVTTFTDDLIAPLTTFTYRVRALRGASSSPWSAEVSVTTPGDAPRSPLPAAPSGLKLTPLVASNLLTWTDRSNDEARFDVQRAEGGDSFRSIALAPADLTSFTDATAHPGWPYVYRVRALSPQGPSGWSNSVATTLPPTIDVRLLRGRVLDSRRARRDRVQIQVGVAFPAAAPVGSALDPVAQGLSLQIGPVDAPVIVSIPAFDPAWVERTGRKRSTATWKSAAQGAQKVTVVFDRKRRTLSVSVAATDLRAGSWRESRVLFACGADGGAHESAWKRGGRGAFRYR